VWRGVVPLPGESCIPALRLIAGFEMSGQPLVWPASTTPGGARSLNEMHSEQNAIAGAQPGGASFEGTVTLSPAAHADASMRAPTPFEPQAAAIAPDLPATAPPLPRNEEAPPRIEPRLHSVPAPIAASHFFHEIA